jgi:hypothetical protein
MNTALSPSNAEEESALCGPSSISAMSPSLTSESPRASTTSFANDSGVSSEVLASILVCTKSPFTWPGAEVKLLLASAVRTSSGVTPSFAMRSGSSQMRMAKTWPPRICALATPFTVCSLGCTTRVR